MAISLTTWAGQTVTPKDDAIIQDACVGRSGILYGCTVAKSSDSALHVTSGYGVIKGRLFNVTSTEVNITLPSSGTQKGVLYIKLDLANTATPIDIIANVGSTEYEPQQDADANFSSGVYELALATFDVASSGISNLVRLESKVPYNRTPVYASLTDLGTSGDTPLTVNGISMLMADDSMALLSASDLFNPPASNLSGQVIIIRKTATNGKALFLADSSTMWQMHIDGQNINGWSRIPDAKDMYYQEGETASLVWAGASYLTSNNTQITFGIPLSKIAKDYRTLSLSDLKMVVRQNGRYLVGPGGAAESVESLGYTVTLALGQCGIIVTVVNPSGFSGTTNNAPVAFWCNLRVTFNA